MKNKYFFVLMLLALIIDFSSAEEIQEKDVEISIILPEKINISVEYQNPLIIKNNNDTAGIDDKLLVNLNYNISHRNNPDGIVKAFSINKSINSFSKSGMGSVNISETGNYTLYASITALNYIDTNLLNNKASLNFEVVGGGWINSTLPENITNTTSNETLINNTNHTNSTNTHTPPPSNNTINHTSNSSLNNTINITINITLNITINNTLNTSINNSNNEINNYSLTQNFSLNYTNNINHTNGTNQSNNTKNECERNFAITPENELMIFGQSLKYKIFLLNDSNSSYPFLIEYWIEDLFGEISKSPLNTSSKSEKSYTPQPEHDSKEKSFVIKTRVAGCTKNFSKLIAFKNEDYENMINQETPFLSMQINEKDEKNKHLMVELEGYKTNTKKTVLSVWIEQKQKKVSETSKVYVEEENYRFKILIPVLIKASAESGEAKLKAEGLDLSNSINLILNMPESTQPPEYNKEEIDIAEYDEKKYESQNQTGAIKNFYTRKEYFDKNIAVYITLDKDYEPMENYALTVESSTEKKEIINPKKTNQVNISISFPNETLTTHLKKGETTIDTKKLRLDLKTKNKDAGNNEETSMEQKTSIEKETKTESIKDQLLRAKEDPLNEKEPDKDLTTESYKEPVGEKENKITGLAAFEKKETQKKYALYGIISIITIVAFFLFKKELRHKILKKNKNI